MVSLFMLEPSQTHVILTQFMLKLLGTKAVQGEEPPKILHFNPRIRGNFSGCPSLTGLSLKVDLDVKSVVVGYLPSSPPSFARQSYLEMSEQWKASPFPTEPIELFTGILSSANLAGHMAVRKSWLISCCCSLLCCSGKF